MVSRRKLLRAGSGVLLASSLSGCSYFEDERYTEVIVHNHTQQQQNIGVAALDPDSDTRSPLFGEKFDLPPAGEGNQETRVFEEAFKSQRALIEVEMGDLQQQFIYQPTPACKEREMGDVLSIDFRSPHSAQWEVGCRGE